MEQTIKTFEDACAYHGLDPDKCLPDVSMYPEKHRNNMRAHAKLVLIVSAINKGREPDWSNYNERKYFPWFEIQASKEAPSGSGFSYANCGYWDSHTSVGSRLCFFNSEDALYAAAQFEGIYKDWLLIN